MPCAAIVNDARPMPSVPSSLSRNAWLIGFHEFRLFTSDILILHGPSKPVAVFRTDVLNTHNDPENTARGAHPGGGGAAVFNNPDSCQTTDPSKTRCPVPVTNVG